MKVLLINDVYKLGRAGDVKKVADGYGRNYLIPQGLAVLATSGALKQSEHIREQANDRRAILNQEMGSIAEMLSDLTLTFSARAGDTDKLYGSITSQMIVDETKEKIGVELNRRQIDHEPIRTLGTHTISVRLTMDLIPDITVIVYREGEAFPVAEDEPVEEAIAVEQVTDEAAETPEAEVVLETVEDAAIEDAAIEDAAIEDAAIEDAVIEDAMIEETPGDEEVEELEAESETEVAE